MHSGGRGLLSKARDAGHRSGTAWAVASWPVTPRCDSLGHQRGRSPPEAGGPDALLGVRELRALRHGKEAAPRRSGELPESAGGMNPPAHSRENVSRATSARPGVDTGRPQTGEEEGQALPSAPATAALLPGSEKKFLLLAGKAKWESRGFPSAVSWHGASFAGEKRGG